MNAAAALDPALARALEPLLARWLHRDVRVATLRRRAHACSSSHPLEALDVELTDGDAARLMLKQTHAPARAGAWVRPAFVEDPEREAEVYREVLGPCGVRAPACLGTVTLPGPEPGEAAPALCLVLERLEAIELFQIDDPDAWQEAARWLARLHARFACEPGRLDRDRADDVGVEGRCLDRAPRLLRRDAAFHHAWWRRAGEYGKLASVPETGVTAEDLLRRFQLAVERIGRLPVTLLHGEFYPANVLVERGPGGFAVRPVDWEMAALGPGLLDLAALTGGRWTAEARDGMTAAYREALPPDLRLPPDRLDEALDDARLVLAVQWLGWARDWTPPPEQAHDWLAEAIGIAARDEVRA